MTESVTGRKSAFLFALTVISCFVFFVLTFKMNLLNNHRGGEWMLQAQGRAVIVREQKIPVHFSG